VLIRDQIRIRISVVRYLTVLGSYRSVTVLQY